MSNFGSTTAATPACSSPTRYDAQPRSSWVICRKIMGAGRGPAPILSGLSRLGEGVAGQVRVAGGHDDVVAGAAVVHDDRADGHAGERAVTAIDRLPDR